MLFFRCNLIFQFFSDGTVVPPDSDPYTIHDQFGETWKVDESDWLFNLYAHTVQIQNDNENGAGLVPVLEPHFASDEKRIEAENVSLVYFFWWGVFFIHLNSSPTPLGIYQKSIKEMFFS